MGEIVNLRSHRRRRDRADRAGQAADNRARFGRSGADKQRDQLLRDQADRVLDNARLDNDSLDDPAPSGAGSGRPTANDPDPD